MPDYGYLLPTRGIVLSSEDDETLASAPQRTSARRIDQVSAAREPRLSWRALEE